MRDPLRPKLPLTGFLLFGREVLPKTTKDTAGSEAMEWWSAMSEEEKLPYLQEAERQREHYETMLESYRSSGMEDAWYPMDHMDMMNSWAPQRPHTAYELFSEQMRRTLEDDDMDGSCAEQLAWAQWAMLSDSEKEPFKREAEALRREMEKRVELHEKLQSLAGEAGKEVPVAGGDEGMWYDAMQLFEEDGRGLEERAKLRAAALEHLSYDESKDEASTAGPVARPIADGGEGSERAESLAKGTRAAPSAEDQVMSYMNRWADRISRRWTKPAFPWGTMPGFPFGTPVPEVDPERPQESKTALALFAAATSKANPTWEPWQARAYASSDWESMPDEEKKPYTQEAEQAAKAYEKAMAEYRSSGKEAAWGEKLREAKRRQLMW